MQVIAQRGRFPRGCGMRGGKAGFILLARRGQGVPKCPLIRLRVPQV